MRQLYTLTFTKNSTVKLKKMQSYFKDKRPVPDWIVDSYLEKPVQEETKTNNEKNDSTQNDYSISVQIKLKKMIPESNDYIKPTDYYF